MRARGAVGAALLSAGLCVAQGGPGARAVQESFEALLFEPPAPGTYELPLIARVAEHTLLGTEGERCALLARGAGEVAIVSFIYRSCGDGAGCPLVLAALGRLDAALALREDLAPRVRLVTISIDPSRDTPKRMAELKRALAPKTSWRFLTATDEAELAPLLSDFGQDVLPLVGEGDVFTGLLQHVVKVFLVDEHRDVRNVYSSGFLAVPILLNDIETVVREVDGSAD